MKRNRRERLLLISLTLCISVGVFGVWIRFPLSAPIHGLEWQSADPAWWRRFAALPFLLCLIPSMGALFLGYRRLGSLLLAAAIVALIAVPSLGCLVDTQWFERYVNDGIEQGRFQFLISFLGGIPSANFNPFMSQADGYQYLPDRVRILANMLGWGWTICLAAVAGLIFVLRRLERLMSLGEVLKPAIVGIVLLAVAGSNVLLADLRYRQGDQRLSVGDYRGALAAYTAALDGDPLLGQSRVFLYNVSRVYYQLGGADDPRGQLYVDQNFTAEAQEIAKALLIISAAHNDGTALGAALARMARRREAELWISQSMRAYRNHDLGSSAIGLRRVLATHDNWRYVHFFLGRVLGQLREFDEAERQLNNLLKTVQNRSLEAAIYNALGDVHAAAGKLEQARGDYAKAYALDKTGNLWAIRGLGGT